MVCRLGLFPVNRPEQNTADARPIFRAAFGNLTAWAHGRYRVKPPASRYFDGSVDAAGTFIPVTDADGHFAGGVRLPHVESTVHGHTSGAPLGLHRPLNPPGPDEPFDPFVFIGGTFSRFDDAQLRDRYPSRHEYVSRVLLAASTLVLKRYITFEESAHRGGQGRAGVKRQSSERTTRDAGPPADRAEPPCVPQESSPQG